jgi:alpha-beta hydrolase superfamily lysophospholipase
VSARRKWFRRVLALFALALVVWLATSLAVAHRLTRRAAPAAPERVPTVAWATPAAHRLNTSDGHELGAWYFPGRADLPAVVLLHGNGESRTACLPRAALLASAGYPVLAVTLRAHGDSTGEVNDFGLSARHDALAAVAWLEARRPGAPAVVWGRSLGAAAALFAAGELGPRVRGYILECPYRDLRTAVQNRLRARLPWGVCHVAFAGLRLTAPLVLPDFDRISPCEAASGVPRETPVLVLAGSADYRAPPADARAVVERLGPRTELVVIEGGDHLKLAEPDPVRYRATILGFLAKCGAP